MKQILRGPREGYWIGWMGRPVRYLLTGEESGDRLSIFTGQPESGGEPPPLHWHDREEEGFFVVKGRLIFELNGEAIELRAGDFINIFPGTAHTLHNPDQESAEVIVFASPSGFEDFQREVGVELTGPEADIPAVDDGLRERVRELAPKYGLNLTAPERLDDRVAEYSLVREGSKAWKVFEGGERAHLLWSEHYFCEEVRLHDRGEFPLMQKPGWLLILEGHGIQGDRIWSPGSFLSMELGAQLLAGDEGLRGLFCCGEWPLEPESWE